MRRSDLYKFILFVILSSLQPGKMQEEQPTSGDVAEVFDEIKSLLKTIKTKTSTHIREFRLFKDEVQGDLSSLRDDLKKLNDSVNNLQTSLTNTNSKLDNLNTTAAQITTELQDMQINISNVECVDAEDFLQLYQYLRKNLTNNPENAYVCGGTGGWRRVAYLDMTDPSTSCPSGWQLTGYSKRTCGRVTTEPNTCDSVTFHFSGGNYSRVCGRIKAYQYGATSGFAAQNTSINAAYVTGVSVTHGDPREHIWTFVAGFSEGSRGDLANCPCYNVNHIRVPMFVSDDYFCESGVNEGWDWNRHENTLHTDHPLWDGEDCVASSTCCTFQNPPYFSRQLSVSTSDDIEARICNHFGHASGRTSDVPIELLELYVQ